MNTFETFRSVHAYSDTLVYSNKKTQSYRQTERQTDREAGRQAGRQAD